VGDGVESLAEVGVSDTRCSCRCLRFVVKATQGGITDTSHSSSTLVTVLSIIELH